ESAGVELPRKAASAGEAAVGTPVLLVGRRVESPVRDQGAIEVRGRMPHERHSGSGRIGIRLHHRLAVQRRLEEHRFSHVPLRAIVEDEMVLAVALEINIVEAMLIERFEWLGAVQQRIANRYRRNAEV